MQGQLPEPTPGPTEQTSPPTIVKATPTQPPTPLPTETPVAPPLASSPGQTWSRPADGMVMIYIPGGEYGMGSTEEEIDGALAPDIRNDSVGFRCLVNTGR